MEHGRQPRLSVAYLQYSTAVSRDYCCILQYSAAASQGYLQYTMVQHSNQPRLSVVYYSTARLPAEASVVYCGTTWLPAEAICSILQYNTAVSRVYCGILQYSTAVSRGYCRYTVRHPRLLQCTVVQHGCQPRLSVVYCCTARLSAEAICSILQYNTAVSRDQCSILQYSTAVSRGYCSILWYTVVQHGCQPRLSVVYYSTTRLSAEVTVIHYIVSTAVSRDCCSILQYSTPVSRGYLQYTIVQHGCQPKLSVVYCGTARLSAETAVVYNSTARLSAEVTCSILQYNTAVSLSYLQYTVVQHGCQPRLLQYTIVQYG